LACFFFKENTYRNLIFLLLGRGGRGKFKLDNQGAQLWGEPVIDANLALPPPINNDTDWKTISLHMRRKGPILQKMTLQKIEEFLKFR